MKNKKAQGIRTDRFIITIIIVTLMVIVIGVIGALLK